MPAAFKSLAGETVVDFLKFRAVFVFPSDLKPTGEIFFGFFGGDSTGRE
jgi:hypothetical protein